MCIRDSFCSWLTATRAAFPSAARTGPVGGLLPARFRVRVVGRGRRCGAPVVAPPAAKAQN
eukprot:15040271-Alexandrium_andersonii.AAC.1